MTERYREAVAVAAGRCWAHGHKTTNVVEMNGRLVPMCPDCADYYDYTESNPRSEAWAEGSA